MNIRLATETDVDEIARIHVAAWRCAYAKIVPQHYLANLSVEESARRWRGLLADSNRRTAVVESEAHCLIGWASYGKSREALDYAVGELYAIYVGHEHWGTAVGRNLLQHVIDGLSQLQLTGMTLWVLERNRRARRFYEKAGFQANGATKTVSIGGRELTEMRYSRSLCDRRGMT